MHEDAYQLHTVSSPFSDLVILLKLSQNRYLPKCLIFNDIPRMDHVVSITEQTTAPFQLGNVGNLSWAIGGGHAYLSLIE